MTPISGRRKAPPLRPASACGRERNAADRMLLFLQARFIPSLPPFQSFAGVMPVNEEVLVEACGSLFLAIYSDR